MGASTWVDSDSGEQAVIEAEVKRVDSGGQVKVPKDWLGQRVLVVQAVHWGIDDSAGALKVWWREGRFREAVQASPPVQVGKRLAGTRVVVALLGTP